MKPLKFILLCVGIILLQIGEVKAQTPPSYFGSQYTDAISHVEDECVKIRMICGTDSHLCVALVFPEMLRYSLWRDVFETAALELAYVNKGKEYADFSIGPFQMKPSFIEKLEEDLKQTGTEYKYTSVICTYASDDEKLKRAERVNRLKSFNWQLKYAHAFVRYNTDKLNTLGIKKSEYLSLIAAAYNYGSHHSIAELREFNQLKAFPYGIGKENPFAYAELVEYFYKNNTLLK